VNEWNFELVVLDESNTVQHFNTSASSEENQDQYKSPCYRRQEDECDKSKENYIMRRKCVQNSLFNALPSGYRSHSFVMLHLIVVKLITSLLQNIILISMRVIQMKAGHGAAS
jgi:hypothetical protein